MKYLICLLFLPILIACNEQSIGSKQVVHTIEELNRALDSLEPGDKIVLANGTWKDTAIELYGNGSEDKPIVLEAETAGKVILEGNSSLKIGGQYIKVSGLYFKNGFTKEKAVIRYKINDSKIAYHSSVTNCVIEDFSDPNRDSKNHWVELWGQHNTFANNYLSGKVNQGPTVRVFLNGNHNVNTHHQIVNNHFGPRPRKGGPRAETLQIGDSYTSMAPSYVNVAQNYFERCNGEVEIISNKSNYTTFRNNVFFESEGSLVMRHGNYATVDGNVFIGNDNSEFIGGIRVINTGHWITNNYFYKLKGNEFRAPIAVMNGIPKSPQNRYNQVTDVVMAYNTFDQTGTPWHFGVGANLGQAAVLPPSEIRSARAIRTIVANNVINNDAQNFKTFKLYDSITDVRFKNNVLNVTDHSDFKTDGLTQQEFSLSSTTHFFKLFTDSSIEPFQGFGFESIKNDIAGTSRKNNNTIGAIIGTSSKFKELLDFSNYGPSWYEPQKSQAPAQEIMVSNTQELSQAIDNATHNTTIRLASGNYVIEQTYAFAKAVTLTSTNPEKPATLEFKNQGKAFELQPRAKLKLKNLNIKGNSNTDAFATLDKNMGQAYELWLDDIDLEGFKSILQTSKASFADTISVKNSRFKNLSKGIQLNKETNDKGDYNAEFVFVENNTFNAIDESVIDYYRGGYDESTIGGNLVVANNQFLNSGKKEPSKILLKTRGIVQVTLRDNTFTNNPVKTIAVLWGAKGQKPENNTVKNSGEIKVVENLKLKLVY